MHTLTPADISFYNSISFLFALGFLFFVVSFILMMVMFSWTYKDVLKHGKKLVVMLVISLTIPLTVGALTQETNVFTKASTTVTVDDVTVNRVEADTVLVQFTTSAPVIAYVEYENASGQVVPVLPTGTRDAKTSHYFRINTNVGEKTDVFIVINGKRYMINGKPIKITQ